MYIYVYICVYVCVCVCVCVFHILRFGIDMSSAINLSEIFHSRLYYSGHLIYFRNKFQTRQLLFTSCLFANITISLH